MLEEGECCPRLRSQGSEHARSEMECRVGVRATIRAPTAWRWKAAGEHIHTLEIFNGVSVSSGRPLHRGGPEQQGWMEWWKALEARLGLGLIEGSLTKEP